MKDLLDLLKHEAKPRENAELIKRLDEVKKQVATIEKKARYKMWLGGGVIAFHVLAAAILWPWMLNAWLTFAEQPAVVVWWHGLALCFVAILRKGVYLLSALTWIAMLFLGGN